MRTVLIVKLRLLIVRRKPALTCAVCAKPSNVIKKSKSEWVTDWLRIIIILVNSEYLKKSLLLLQYKTKKRGRERERRMLADSYLFGFFVIGFLLRFVVVGGGFVVLLRRQRRDKLHILLRFLRQVVSQFRGVHFSDHRQLIQRHLRLYILHAWKGTINHQRCFSTKESQNR